MLQQIFTRPLRARKTRHTHAPLPQFIPPCQIFVLRAFLPVLLKSLFFHPLFITPALYYICLTLVAYGLKSSPQSPPSSQDCRVNHTLRHTLNDQLTPHLNTFAPRTLFSQPTQPSGQRALRAARRNSICLAPLFYMLLILFNILFCNYTAFLFLPKLANKAYTKQNLPNINKNTILRYPH